MIAQEGIAMTARSIRRIHVVKKYCKLKIYETMKVNDTYTFTLSHLINTLDFEKFSHEFVLVK